MKKLIVSFIAFILISNVSGTVYNIGNHEIHYDNGIYFKIYQSDTFRIDTTTFIIKYVEGTEGSVISSIENTHSLVRKHEFITGYISYNYNSGLGFIAMCTNLTNEPEIEVLELNCEVKYLCDAMIPNDDYFDEQWYLDTIKAPLAWNITTGDEDVIVAIIDSGFDWEHNDIGPDGGYESTCLHPYEDAWDPWNEPCNGNKINESNLPYIPNTNYTDVWKGWASSREIDCDPEILENDTREYDLDELYNQFPDTTAEKLWRHGTFIAGIIGAKTNSSLDISGIAGGWGDKGVSLLYLNASFR